FLIGEKNTAEHDQNDDDGDSDPDEAAGSIAGAGGIDPRRRWTRSTRSWRGKVRRGWWREWQGRQRRRGRGDGFARFRTFPFSIIRGQQGILFEFLPNQQRLIHRKRFIQRLWLKREFLCRLLRFRRDRRQCFRENRWRFNLKGRLSR